MVDRAITGFHQDSEGDWVAELVCGHDQHVRHRPPFQLRPWVVTPAGRHGRLGTPLACPLCDRGELPESVAPVRRSPVWDESTLPPGLRRQHRLARGTWGRLEVEEGRVSFHLTESDTETELTGPTWVAIPPEVPHQLFLHGPVRLSIEFLAVTPPREPPGRASPAEGTPENGGEVPCFAGSLCPECGAVVGADPHRPDCSRGGSA